MITWNALWSVRDATSWTRRKPHRFSTLSQQSIVPSILCLLGTPGSRHGFRISATMDHSVSKKRWAYTPPSNSTNNIHKSSRHTVHQTIPLLVRLLTRTLSSQSTSATPMFPNSEQNLQSRPKALLTRRPLLLPPRRSEHYQLCRRGRHSGCAWPGGTG